MISPFYKFIIKLIYTPLMLTVVAVWIVDVIYYEDFWQCSTCRSGEDPSPLPWLVYASMWSNWLAAGTFTVWAYFMDTTSRPPATTTTSTSHHDAPIINSNIRSNRDEGKNVPENDDDLDNDFYDDGDEYNFCGTVLGRALFSLALPLVTSVSFSYIYYMVTNPVVDITNTDVCYTLVRSAAPKEGLHSAHVYLYFGVLSDMVVHYLNSLLLMTLYLNGDFPYQSAIPWSTLFTTGLGMIIVAVQNSGVTVYCGGNAWFSVGGIVVSNFVFHCFFVLGARGKLCCRSWSCVAVQHRYSDEDEYDNDTDNQTQRSSRRRRRKPATKPVMLDIEHNGRVVAHLKSTSLITGGVTPIDVEA